MEELIRFTKSYETAISLWKLASEQLYSRFSAMLTANSIIMITNGWLITQEVGTSLRPFYYTFPGVGIILCVLGACFIHFGNRAEDHYRKLAYKLENMCTTEHIAISPNKGKSFKWISYAVFFFFVVLYAVIIYLLSNK